MAKTIRINSAEKDLLSKKLDAHLVELAAKEITPISNIQSTAECKGENWSRFYEREHYANSIKY